MSTLCATHGPARPDLRDACEALRRWDGTGRTRSRGPHLWDELWRDVGAPWAAELHAVPFDAGDPLHTPRGLRPDRRWADALARAAKRVREAGYALDAERGETLFVHRNGLRIPLYGGCGGAGYFSVMCSDQDIAEGGYSFDGDPHGNSYVQVVDFPDDGVQAHTLLAHGQSDDPASPHHGDLVRRYAAHRWLRLPFREIEILRDPTLKVHVLSE